MALLQPESKAPDFAGTAFVDGAFKDISLSDYKGKYVVLLFYPADFTFLSPTEIIAFSDRAEEFRKEGCEVIAVSTDSQFVHMEDNLYLLNKFWTCVRQIQDSFYKVWIASKLGTPIGGHLDLVLIYPN